MRNPKTLIIAFWGMMICGSVLAADAPRQPSEVSGMLGMAPVAESSCIAVWVPVGDTEALAGVAWYNNDETVVFPEVLVASGQADAPVALADADVVAELVSGGSAAWSEVEFDQPVASIRGGFYVLFRVPEGSEQTGFGLGGGAGIGYVSDGGCAGWLAADGESWVKVGRSFGFAVLPHYVDREPWMLEKSQHRPEDESNEEIQTPNVDRTTMRAAAPNPFNPSTVIKFSLRMPSDVELVVYDVRGRKVRELVRESFPAGDHSATWQGQDNHGRQVSSGVYMVRFRADGRDLTQRIVLLK